MSLPRPVLPQVTYLLTRRCLERRFFLKPGPKINQIFKFCLGVAAQRTGVQVHAYCALSNHYHLLVTDRHGRLPDFMHWLNEYVAKCVNAELGRWESFWAPGTYSAVALENGPDILDKLVYLFANPVAAGLVSSSRDWPGASSTPTMMQGAAEVILRPRGFFRENGPVPRKVRLELVMPTLPDVDLGVLSHVQQRLAEREDQLRQEARRRNRSFMGARAVKAQSPLSRPRTRELHRRLNPRVGARDKWRRIEALRRLRTFVDRYRDARARFAEGDRTVVFPLGTWAMRIRVGVLCAGP
ncbi:MAG: hypothetical protein GY716_15065 [bacterium]|nr:hypothetical protein [bacterium]